MKRTTMLQNTLVLLVAGLFAFAGTSVVQAVPININWNNASSGNYSNASNWTDQDDANNVPDSGYVGGGIDGEIAIFNGTIVGTSAMTITVDNGPYTVSGVQVLNGADIMLDLQGGTNLIGQLSPWGTPVDINGSLTVSNGTLDISSGSDKATVVRSGAALTVLSGAQMNSRSFSNSGLITIESGSYLDAYNGNSYAGGTGRILIQGGRLRTKFTNLPDTSVLEFELNNADYGTARFTPHRLNGLGDLALSLADGFSANIGDEFMLIDSNETTEAGFSGFDNVSDGDTITVGSYVFELDTANNLDYKLITTAIPEPATVGLLAIGGLALIRRRRR